MKWLSALFLIAQLIAAPSNVRLEQPQILRSDTASILRGAKAFKGRCLSCHALQYAGYAPLIKAAGITSADMPQHLADAWQGHPPPDLSLVARVRGNAWVYTYLHSFYKDPNNHKGYNNLLMPNTSMPAILSDLSGVYVLNSKPEQVYGVQHLKPWFAYLEQESSGSLSPELYSYYVLDLVTFLDYVAEPYRHEREHIGWKVLSFLFVFALIARLLYKSYWQEVK